MPNLCFPIPREMALLVSALLTGLLQAEASTGSLPRSTPEAQGVDVMGLGEFVEAANHQLDSLHSFMLVRHGRVVAEGWWAPYDASTRHELYSLSKSFTSTAVGMAVAEGLFSLDDPVLKFFPEDAPANPSGNLQSMRVRDLLCMSTGHQSESPSGPSVMTPRTFLAQPVPFKPGTHFLYNTPATFMLSAIVQKTSGQTALDYLRPRLFEPLGIESPTWQTNAQGIALGGYGLSVRTEDIAKFGQLYLQEGRWKGRTLLQPSWVRQATTKQTSNGSNPQSDWDQGYGFQFWRCRHGCYRGDGAFGQYCVVMPEQDAVLAITSGLRDMQAVLNLVWEKLLPAMKPGRLAANRAGRDRLADQLRGLQMAVPKKGATAPARVEGKKYVFSGSAPQIQSLQVVPEAGGSAVTLVCQSAAGEQRMVGGDGAWHRGRLAWGSFPETNVATSGAWTAEDTYTAKICFYETPFVATLRLRFSGDEVSLESEVNVSFGAAPALKLQGKVAP